MEPSEPTGGERAEPRRPLLMDPAGSRPTGFAPPTDSAGRAIANPQSPAASPVGAHAAPGTAVAGSTAGGAHAAAGTSSMPPTGPMTATGTSSVLAATVAAPAVGARPGEASFGPVSQVVRLSVRTASSRLDLVLPDRSTVAETLETVLELAPRSLREQAIAHGGWILRTAGGGVLAGSSTLLDQGVVDGTTLFLTGIDSTANVVVYDDLADAIADSARRDGSAWPSGGWRRVALAAAGVFAAVGLLALLSAGPPWSVPALALAVLTVLAAAAAGWLGRGVRDGDAALLVGAFGVASGAAAGAVATAGTLSLPGFGAPQVLLGAVAAAVVAAVVAPLIGGRPVLFVAAVTGSLLVCVAALCCVLFPLPPAGGAAIVVGAAICLMPAAPRVALILGGVLPLSELGPPRTGAGADETGPSVPEGQTPDGEAIDERVVRHLTRRAAGQLTALLQGLAWTALAGCVVLAVNGGGISLVLSVVVALALLLRSRQFPALGQRLPLIIAGIGALVAVLVSMIGSLDSSLLLPAVAVPAVVGMVVAVVLAVLRRPAPIELVRAMEIADVVATILVIPLVAGLLGLFAFVRGIGG